MNVGDALVWIGFGLGILLLSSLVWGGLLRRQVQRRTRELQEAISRHEETERALESSESYLRSLVETLPQNILRKDLEGRFTFVNELFCRSVGKPMSEILGR
ncbi:MAG: PAS domain S-box protein, partial [Planctomycetaceae bacterium]